MANGSIRPEKEWGNWNKVQMALSWECQESLWNSTTANIQLLLPPLPAFHSFLLSLMFKCMWIKFQYLLHVHDLHVSFSQYCCHFTPLCPPCQNLSTFHSESQFQRAGLDVPSAIALQMPRPDPFPHCSASPECPLPTAGAYGCLAGRTVGFGPTAECPASFGSPAWALPEASPCFLPAPWWPCSLQGWCPWSFNKIHSTVWTLT